MKRRSFLAHLGTAAGVTLLAPWARQAFAAGGAPRRFVFVVEGNSYDPVAVMSNAARAAIDAQATNSTTGRRSFSRSYGHDSPHVVGAGDLGTAIALSPLLSGGSGLDLVSRSSVTLGLSSTVTGGGHTTNCGGLSSTRSTPGNPGGPVRPGRALDCP